jgi:hypothetical protein
MMSRQRFSDEKPKLVQYPRVFTICREGLLFVDRIQGLSGEDIVSLMLNEKVKQRLGSSFLGFRVRHSDPRLRWGRRAENKEESAPTYYGLLLTTEAQQHVLADAPQEKGRFIYLRLGEVVAASSLEGLVDRCVMLNRGLGCDTCPAYGAECLALNLPERMPVIRRIPDTNEELPLPGSNEVWTARLRDDMASAQRQLLLSHTFNELREGLKSWQSTIGGFLYLSPGVTQSDPFRPGGSENFCRTASEHYFNYLESVHSELSKRSHAAAQTRVFVQTQCQQCYFGSRSICDRRWARHCEHGAWTEDRLTEYTLECVRRRLVETKSTLTLQHLWAIANICGNRFSRRDDRTGRLAEFVVQRVGENSGSGDDTNRHPCIFVSRTARDARRELSTLKFFSIKALRRFLPEVMQKQLDAVPPLTKENRKQLALWLQLSVTSHGRSYSLVFSTKNNCGYAWVQPRVGTVQFSGAGIKVELWFAKFERTHNFYSFQRILDHYGQLPYFNINEAEEASLGRPLKGHVH